jgi:hypothetical protein
MWPDLRGAGYSGPGHRLRVAVAGMPGRGARGSARSGCVIREHGVDARGGRSRAMDGDRTTNNSPGCDESPGRSRFRGNRRSMALSHHLLDPNLISVPAGHIGGPAHDMRRAARARVAISAEDGTLTSRRRDADPGGIYSPSTAALLASGRPRMACGARIFDSLR